MVLRLSRKLSIFVGLLVLLSTATAKAETGFRLVGDTGIDTILPFEEDHEKAYLYYTGHAGGAICLGDVNGDQRPDIYLSNALRENTLYTNEGNFKFQRMDGPFGGKETWGTGANLVDIDADGDLDICQVNYDAPIQFFRNDGKGKFTEVDNAFGLNLKDATLAVSFADADNDGDLDAFVLCNTYFRAQGRPKEPPFTVKDGKPVTKPGFEKYYRVEKSPVTGQFTMDQYGRRDYFFLNVGSRKRPVFRDESARSGLADYGFGLSCVWWDYNNDGRMDLYVANDFISPDRLFHNAGVKDGVPRFQEVMGRIFPTGSWSSMGSGIADVNNDGLAELMTVDMSARTHFKSKINMGEMKGDRRWIMENGWPRQIMRNHLFVNAGRGLFREEAWMRGLASTDWSWAVKWGDYDEDGWSDVLVTNGMTRNFSDSDHSAQMSGNKTEIGKTTWELYRDQPPMKEANVVFRNVAGKKFKEVGKAWGLDLMGISYGAASGDIDGDGDLDLIVTDLGHAPKVYENRIANDSTRIRVRLVCEDSNAMGIGARVTVLDDQGASRTRWMMPWMGFQSQDENVLHFGLGGAAPVRIEVQWPNQEMQTVLVKKGQAEISIHEEDTSDLFPSKERPLWVPRALPWKHEESFFDDFARQPLLPGKLSQPGPCIATADIDGDGDLDAYLGGAAGQPGALAVNFNGQLKVGSGPWGDAVKSEDAAALWFDADQDGDQDLYVVSGSVEASAGDPFYRDRLYRNETVDGNFNFEAVEDGLPDLRDSGSCVVAGDFDKDGDLDLFVGSRCKVGEYPMSPASRLLRNDSDKSGIRFSDATKTIAPELLSAGMVTSATSADLDADQDDDLILATEWGPIRILWNNDGKLATKNDGDISSRNGWWQSVVAGDFDQDGDIDLLTGNVGWNTKYKRPTSKKPAQIYYGDMDGTGKSRIIEAKNSEDSLLPVRGRSCSTHAIPALKDKFKSYRQFALSDLTGIYGQQCLSGADKFIATELASGWWRNDGKGNFSWDELPWELQVSQVNDFAAGDIDGDGRVEIVVAQNEDAREPETGLWRSGLGVVMRFENDGWQVVPTLETGLIMKGAAKSIALIDVEKDGKLELLVGQNASRLLLFAAPQTVPTSPTHPSD